MPKYCSQLNIMRFCVFSQCIFFIVLAWYSQLNTQFSPYIWVTLSTLSFIALGLNSILLLYNGTLMCSKEIIGWTCVLILIGFFSQPFLEDDFYRYLWDGYRFYETGNPYGLAPIASMQDTSIDQLFMAILHQVNYPELKTIYGPVLEYIFLLNHLISPGSLIGLKLIYAIAHIALVIFLCRRYKSYAIILFAWNPLLLKEVFFNVHPDIIPAILSFISLWALINRYPKSSAVALALAISAKIYVIILIPYFLLLTKPKYWLILMLVLMCIYLPFLIGTQGEFSSLIVFANNWQFNSFLYQPIANSIDSTTTKYILIVLLGIFYLIYLMYFLKQRQSRLWEVTDKEIMPRADWLILALLLVSPVVNAWYVIWLLPFCVVYPSLWGFGVGLLMSLSYLTGISLGYPEIQDYELLPWVQIVEYGGLIALMGLSVTIRFRSKCLL